MSSSAGDNLFGFPQGFGGAPMPQPHALFQTPSSRFAPPQAAPVAAAAAASKQAWYATSWIWILLAFIIVFGGIAYWARTRYYAGGSTRLCPYSAAINTVSNSEQQADLREWASLWMQARRPNVKRVLSEVLNSELGGIMDKTKDNNTTAPPQSVSAADPAFTVA